MSGRSASRVSGRHYHRTHCGTAAQADYRSEVSYANSDAPLSDRNFNKSNMPKLSCASAVHCAACALAAMQFDPEGDRLCRHAAEQVVME